MIDLEKKIELIIGKKYLKKFLEIYENFSSLDELSNINTVIDCCSGNGFFGLYLLLRNKVNIIAIDNNHTKKAERLESYFYLNHPDIMDRYKFQKLDIEKYKIPVIENSIILGIHACGDLSDIIIENSVSNNIPFIINPCCYNKYKICWKDSKIKFNGNLGDYVDNLRYNFIKSKYRKVILKTLNNLKNGSNRLIIAIP